MVYFQAEQILSPQKTASPKKRLPTLGESPVKSYSPLSSVSLHKLTTSPIINTQVNAEMLMECLETERLTNNIICIVVLLLNGEKAS